MPPKLVRQWLRNLVEQDISSAVGVLAIDKIMEAAITGLQKSAQHDPKAAQILEEVLEHRAEASRFLVGLLSMN